MRKLKYVKLFENFQINEGIDSPLLVKNFTSDLNNLKADKNVIFLKEKNTNTKYTIIFHVDSVKSLQWREGYTPAEKNKFRDDKFVWVFEGYEIAVITGEGGDERILGIPFNSTKITKEKTSNHTPIKLFVDLTDVFPEGIRGEHDYSMATFYISGGSTFNEYELEDEDIEKVVNLIEENDKAGVLHKVKTGQYDDLSPDLGDFMKVGNFMESRRYKRYSRR
jgi:hypothetical protein